MGKDWLEGDKVSFEFVPSSDEMKFPRNSYRNSNRDGCGKTYVVDVTDFSFKAFPCPENQTIFCEPSQSFNHRLLLNNLRFAMFVRCFSVHIRIIA